MSAPNQFPLLFSSSSSFCVCVCVGGGGGGCRVENERLFDSCICLSAINGSDPGYLSELLHVYTPPLLTVLPS